MSKSDMVVLGFLNIKPMYGYEIIQFVQQRQLDVWAGIKMPSVYKALHRLEKKDYIEGKQITEGNNPPRTVYSQTKAGKKYFRTVLEHYLNQKNLLSQDFWLTISFIYKNIDRNCLVQSIDRKIEVLNKHLKGQKEIEYKIESPKSNLKIPFYVKILMDVGKEIHKVELKALKTLKSEAEKEKNKSAFITKEEI